ncbi:MAG: hypothetical protein GY820_39275 [Gammaproteobacteria bacterium]|nr:hypothetical protein [Gammaproteobacteria bacterium]
MKQTITAFFTIILVFLSVLAIVLYVRVVQLDKLVKLNTANIEQLRIDVDACNNKDTQDLDRAVKLLADEMNDVRSVLTYTTDLSEQNFVYKGEGL